ncbi:MAG: hypothetical protein ACREOO_13710 [bacterium]
MVELGTAPIPRTVWQGYGETHKFRRGGINDNAQTLRQLNVVAPIVTKKIRFFQVKRKSLFGARKDQRLDARAGFASTFRAVAEQVALSFEHADSQEPLQAEGGIHPAGGLLQVHKAVWMK